MQVKRFVAADMRRALELVRLEMGPDAVILSSKRHKDGVEGMTTLEEPPQVPASLKGMVPTEDHSTGFESPLASDRAWGDQASVNSALKENAHLGSRPATRPNPRTGCGPLLSWIRASLLQPCERRQATRPWYIRLVDRQLNFPRDHHEIDH